MYFLISQIDELNQKQVDNQNEKKEILIIATTSQLDKLDKSVRRGGRLDIDIRLDMPSDNERFLVFKEHLRHLPN